MTKKEKVAIAYLADRSSHPAEIATVLLLARTQNAEPLAAAKRYIALLADIDAELTAAGGWR